MTEWFQICLGGIIVLKGDRNDSFLVLPAGQVAISTVISILLSDFTEMTGFGRSKFYVAIKKDLGFKNFWSNRRQEFFRIHFTHYSRVFKIWVKCLSQDLLATSLFRNECLKKRHPDSPKYKHVLNNFNKNIFGFFFFKLAKMCLTTSQLFIWHPITHNSIQTTHAGFLIV